MSTKNEDNGLQFTDGKRDQNSNKDRAISMLERETASGFASDWEMRKSEREREGEEAIDKRIPNL